MKKTAIKIAASTAVAASAFVAVAPTQQADAATNVNQLITDAQNAGTVLKWAISVEGTADYKTEPWKEYNAAKDALKKAEAAINGLGTSAKLSAQAKLVDPKVQITRAGAYIDAITSGKKILDKNAAFETAVKTGDLDKVEKEYHVVTEEFRKQTILNYRVYGQTTRDEILKEYKLPIEKTVRGFANEVTVHMLTKAAAADVKANKLEEAALKLTEAQTILDANVLNWETTLQKSADDVAASMPLTVLSVSRTDKNTVVVKFSKTPADLLAAGQFTFDNNLIVQSATLAADKKTVTLKTTDQVAGKTYALSYQGVATGKTFSVPANPADGSTTIDAADTARIETSNTRTYTASVKNSDNGNYTGEVGITLKNADGTPYTGTAFISNIDGTSYATGAAPAKVAAGTDGKVTIVLSGSTATDSVYPLFTNLEDTSKTVKGGLTYFYKAAVTSSLYTEATPGVYGANAYDFIDKTNDYVVLAGQKYNFDSNDTFIVSNKVVTLDAFEAALSKNDEYYVDYQATKANTSVFTIKADVDANAEVEITNPSKAISYDGTTFRLTGEGEAGSKVYIYKESATGIDLSTSPIVDGTLLSSSADVQVAEAVVSSNGTWAVQASNLTQNDVNKLYAVQVEKGQTVDQAITAGAFDFTYLKVGAFAAEGIKWTDGATQGISIGDTLLFDFANDGGLDAVNFTHDFKDGTKATVVINDGFGKTATLTVEHKTTTAADTLEVTNINATAGFDFQQNANAGNFFNIQSVSGLSNEDNVQFNVNAGVKYFTR